MSWTTPKTWAVDELVTASALNSHLRDNLNYLFGRPKQSVKRDNNVAYTTTSTSFVDVDSTNLKLTLTLTGSSVLIGFTAVPATVNNIGFLDFAVDGARYASEGTEGLAAVEPNSYVPMTMTALITGLSAGSHNFTVQWRVNGGSMAIRAGSGAAGYDQIPTFWAIEVGS
jgi:hypothetical protein